VTSVENRNFFHPRVFCALANAAPLELDISAVGKKNYNDGATGSRKKFGDISSRVDTIHERVRRTDRHRTIAKTALMYKSCGKNLLPLEDDYFEMRLAALNPMDRYRLGFV